MTVEGVSAPELDDVFGLVANELRIDILRELWTQRRDPVSFSELRSRVDVRDSGKFNYHLNVLVPEFVRKSEQGYELTHAGQQIIGAAVSGCFTDADEVDVGPVPAGRCMFCDGELTVRYERGDAVVTCSECGELITRMPVPPVTVAGVAADSLPQLLSTHVLTLVHQLSRGFCTLCHGQVDATLTALSSEESVTYRSALDVRFECRECGDRTNLNAGAVVLDHPAVVSFLFDAGIDPRSTYVWELTSVLDPEATVTGEDPIRLELAVDVDGDELELTLDESATVIDYERP